MFCHDYVIDYVRGEVRKLVHDVLDQFGKNHNQWDMIRFTDFNTTIHGGNIECYLKGHFVRNGNKSPNFGIVFVINHCLWTQELPKVYTPVFI